jgi:hypothetical protein
MPTYVGLRALLREIDGFSRKRVPAYVDTPDGSQLRRIVALTPFP